MKNVVSLLPAALMLACLMTGCGCRHQWAEATCTAPKTCTLCGKTEGLSWPHSFLKATCASPSVCKDCGLRRGDPLPHTDISAANFQDPPMCLDCGAVLGSSLTPIYEEKGIPMNLLPGVPTPYVTNCQDDPALTTTGTAVLTDCGVLNAAERSEWGEIFGFPLEDRVGYEWIAAKIEITFDDENAWNYGLETMFLHENYFDPYLYDDTLEELSGWVYKSAILWHGETKDMCTVLQCDNGEWTPEKTILVTWYAAFAVPEGYRGAVVGLVNSAESFGAGAYFVDDPMDGALLYRIG